MSLNGQALLLVAMPMAPGTVFSQHSHEAHQIIWSDAGMLEVRVDAQRWVLPPTRALWMPAGVMHETRTTGSAAVLRGGYLSPVRYAIDWPEPRPLEVTPLLSALLLHLSGELDSGQRARAEALLADLLVPADTIPLQLVLPQDDRALAVARGLLAAPADARPLSDWGREAGASARTLSRLFLAETGVSFGAWRTAARVYAALDQLGTGVPVSQVSTNVGFSTPSAFIAAFRRVTGSTPGSYFG